ncbi:hypothetical protein O1D97_12155 [Marinomonas sp. 15G1-11]|uniref:Uncharacterized protein n=1 Tax=Marinomonas phaeophyticola TaxID=3004091 RepID=A0ABT4JX31_9GAMM|nr:hypothetical protein [Marinomonas sp. 15G1-11]MCZ2722358.1 hypothetical protein [Marinomonas sp. 15G1-11]
MSFNTNANIRNIEALLLQQYLRSSKLTQSQKKLKQELIGRISPTFYRSTHHVTASSAGGME